MESIATICIIICSLMLLITMIIWLLRELHNDLHDTDELEEPKKTDKGLPDIKATLESTQSEIIYDIKEKLKKNEPVPVCKVHRFTNQNSGLPDAFAVDSVRVSETGELEAIIRRPDYEKLSDKGTDISEITQDTDCFLEPETTAIVPDGNDTGLFDILKDICKAVADNMKDEAE